MQVKVCNKDILAALSILRIELGTLGRNQTAALDVDNAWGEKTLLFIEEILY